MPRKTKRSQHLNKIYEARKTSKSDNTKETTEITPNKPKYERRPFQEIPPEIFADKTRSGSQQPRHRTYPTFNLNYS